jgi:hypothetical protein
VCKDDNLGAYNLRGSKPVSIYAGVGGFFNVYLVVSGIAQPQGIKKLTCFLQIFHFVFAFDKGVEDATGKT